MREKGNTPVLSINIGTYETAPRRREAYIKAAKRSGYWSLGAWCRAVLDRAAKHKPKEPIRRSLIVGTLLIAGLLPARASDYYQMRQADAAERLARAEEMRNATEGATARCSNTCEGLEGGAVPEGCQLRLDVRHDNPAFPKGYIKSIEGPDGKQHGVYLLYCP